MAAEGVLLRDAVERLHPPDSKTVTRTSATVSGGPVVLSFTTRERPADQPGHDQLPMSARYSFEAIVESVNRFVTHAARVSR
jgi:hypothetical protein